MGYKTDHRSRTRAIAVYGTLLCVGAALGLLVRAGVITDHILWQRLPAPNQSYVTIVRHLLSSPDIPEIRSRLEKQVSEALQPQGRGGIRQDDLPS